MKLLWRCQYRPDQHQSITPYDQWDCPCRHCSAYYGFPVHMLVAGVVYECGDYCLKVLI